MEKEKPEQVSSFEEIELEVELEAREYARRLLQRRLQERAQGPEGRLSPLGRSAASRSRTKKAKASQPPRNH